MLTLITARSFLRQTLCLAGWDRVENGSLEGSENHKCDKTACPPREKKRKAGKPNDLLAFLGGAGGIRTHGTLLYA